MVERDRGNASAGIVGIEDSADACAAARANAERFGVRARYLEGRVEDRLPAALSERGGTRFVLNPGRSGCRPNVLRALGETAGARIAYLSCSPDTLARDLALLSENGLGVREMQEMVDNLTSQLDQALYASDTQLNNILVENVTIADGVMTISGRPR